MSTFYFRSALTFLLALCAVAQQRTSLYIRGQITDSASRDDVAGVTVSAVEARHDATSDANGFFTLELRDETKAGAAIRIHVQKEGYKSVDLTEAASENVTYAIRISRVGRSHPIGIYPHQPPLQRTAKFVVMIPFDTAPGAFPIPVDENPDDPLSRTYQDIHSLALNGTIPDSVRKTTELGQITWTSRSVSMDESTTFLARLLQYYILESIDSLQRNSLTLFIGYPAQANAGIEPPDALTYPDDKLEHTLENNQFFRPFLHRPNPGQLTKMRMPRDTNIEFKEEGHPPKKCVLIFERPHYFEADFEIEVFAGTGPGSLPKYFRTTHPETVMQWPFFVTMRYSIEHRPEDDSFNPDNYAKWLDALYEGLVRKMMLPDIRGIAIDQGATQTANLKAAGGDKTVISVPTLSAPPAASSTPARELTNRTPRELLAFYENVTPLQADALIAPFKGLWIRVVGKVETVVDAGKGGAQVWLTDDEGSRCACRFEQQWREALTRLSKSDKINVQGRITESNGVALFLTDCEFAQ